LEKLNVRVVYSSIRHPQSNPSERVMRELSRLFRVYCNRQHVSWPELIPWINKWINLITHESTHLTPQELHFGRKPTFEFPDGVNLQNAGDSITPELVLEFASRRLRHAARTRGRNQRGRTHVFALGQKVLLRTPRESNTDLKLFRKFFHLFTGPFTISRMSGPNACHLTDSEGRNVGIYNFNNLRPYYEP
jgi:hypothetical protein